MRALSVRQPWAELIISGLKLFELRSRPTRVRGRIWIHAALRVEREWLTVAGMDEAQAVTGALIGSVEIIDCMPLNDHIVRELQAAGPFFGELSRATGYVWRLAAPRRLDSPIRWRGALGFFHVPSSVCSD